MNNKIISRNVVSGRHLVSTVDLGGIFGFETMVFNCNPDGSVTDWLELDVRNYDNVLDAIAGHAVMVQKWTDKVNNI